RPCGRATAPGARARPGHARHLRPLAAPSRARATPRRDPAGPRRRPRTSARLDRPPTELPEATIRGAACRRPTLAPMVAIGGARGVKIPGRRGVARALATTG